MKQRVFQVFYRDYGRDLAVSSAKPESLLASRIQGLAERLLASEDNFVGILDRNDVILQLYRQADGLVAVELLPPDSRRYLRCAMPLEQVLILLADLPEVFGRDLVPDASWVQVGG